MQDIGAGTTAGPGPGKVTAMFDGGRPGRVPVPSDLDGPEPADRHTALGMGTDEVVALYRGMLLSRRIDERQWIWNRQGRVAFVVPMRGHEGMQVAAGMALRPGHDWVCHYYRDIGIMVGLGMPTHEMLLHVLAKADDPHSGGRQFPSHFSSVERRVLSSSSAIATQIPHAVGIAQAEVFRGGDAVVLCAHGEGSTAKGDFHESVNWAAIHRLPVVFFCENNGYAISMPEALESPVPIVQRAAGYGIPGVEVDGNDALAVLGVVQEAVERARRGEGPTLVEALGYRMRPHTSDDDDRRYRDAEEVASWEPFDAVARLRRYIAAHGLATADELDGVDAGVEAEVAECARRAQEAAAPDPATASDKVWARPLGSHRSEGLPQPSADPVSAEATSVPEGEEITIVEAVRRTLGEVMEADERVFVIGQDVGRHGGVFHATEGLQARFGQRSFDAPLAESAIVGVAIGAAVAGLRPVAEVQFADYLHAGFDQLVSEASRLHYRSNGAWSCPMVMRVPYGAGVHGGPYHSQSIEAFYAHVPGLKVIAPSTPADVAGLLRAAIEDPDPVIFVEHKKTYRSVKGAVPVGHRVEIGRASLVRAGRHATVVTYGYLRHVAEQAVAVLADEGIDVEVLDLRTISPLDRDAIQESVSRTGRCLVLTEDNFSFGVAAEVSAWVAESCFYRLDAPVARLTVPDVPAMPFASSLEAVLLPDADRVADALRRLVQA